MIINAEIFQHYFTLFIDTGASVNIMSSDCFNKIRSVRKKCFILEPPDIRLTGIDGSALHTLGKIPLDTYLCPDLPPVTLTFYIADGVKIPADALIGRPSLTQHEIDLYPRLHGIYFRNRFITEVMHAPQATETNTPVHTVSKTPTSQHDSLTFTSTTESLSHITSVPQPTDMCMPCLTEPKPQPHPRRSRRSKGRQTRSRRHTQTLASLFSTPIPTLPHSYSEASLQEYLGKEAKERHAVTSRTVRLDPFSSTLIDVRVRNASTSDAITLPESVTHRALSVPSALCKLSPTGTCQLYVVNITKFPVTLDRGTRVCTFFIYPQAVQIMEDPATTVNTVTSHSLSTQSDIQTHLQPTDYPEAHDALMDVLTRYRDVIALPGEPLGKTNVVQHKIHLIDNAKPVYIPAYRLPHSKRALVESTVSSMLQDGIIEHSVSPFNSPMFLVPKRSGDWRTVVDFRELNKLTVPPRYPMPVLEEILNSLGDENAVFSTLDLCSGFWQVELDPDSRAYTAFSTPSGHFQYRRMPMGLVGAPSTFQRLINSVFSGLVGNTLFSYLDDIIIFSKSVPEHLEKLNIVLQRLQQAGLKLKLTKCALLRKETTFLGHTINASGIHTSQDKIEAMINYPTPTTVDEVRSFLGLSGYYRRFIKGYASIASPLSALLKKDVQFEWSNAR